VKYNSSGQEQWVARYNGPGNNDDEATALAIDGSGNVYVTGWSFNSGTYTDYATIKYNSTGEEQWVARYNVTGYSDDHATAIAIDGLGNVYVTGYSHGSGTGFDYATIKYNSTGEEQWVARYNGPGNNDDEAHALTVDGSGNVYVTGYSASSVIFPYNYDYATIKYNSTGVEQWVVRYNGPGNSDDRATALAVDGSGNVYVTGYSYGSGTLNDYATIKYNSTGEEQWVARYNGSWNSDDNASALVVDGSGNVYVTGLSFDSTSSYDYATIKYNSSGVEQWVARYNGTWNFDDRATALAVDGSGNVYVTGYSYGSGTHYDYATIKYNSSGVEQWVARYNGPRNYDDQAYALAADGLGNVYVTGISYGSGTLYDYATIKYNSLGEEQWVARYNGPGNSDDGAKAIALDGSGNLYVTGYSNGDYVTIKYNSRGTVQWVAKYDGPWNSWNEATALALDASGNVYVTGTTTSNNGTQYTTIKYNSSKIVKCLNYGERWNLVSTPLLITDPRVTLIFPSAISKAYKYVPLIGYQIQDSLLNGIGYWIKFANPENICFNGAQLTSDSVSVQEGWNLIGSFSQPLSVSSIISEPPGIITSQFFTYTGGYITSDTIYPGKGYWVKVNQSGELILSSNTLKNALSRRIKIIKTTELPPNPPEMEEITQEFPKEFMICQNYPNPFNPSTVIKYQLPVNSLVTLKIYNVLGQEVGMLVNGIQEAGYKSVEWNANNVTSGIYFYRIEAVSVSDPSNRFMQVKKMLLLR